MKENHTETPKNPELIDPEPISLALSIFAALTGAAGLIIQTSQHRRERSQDRATARKLLFIIDRSLNRIDEAYRSIISLYDEHNILSRPLVLGRSPLYVEKNVHLELERLQSNIFYGGRDLQNALAELSESLDRRERDQGLELAKRLDEVFQKARRSEMLLDFVIETGIMLELVTTFTYQIGDNFEFEPSSLRISLLKETIAQLQRRRR